MLIKKIIKWILIVAIPFLFQYLSQANKIFTVLIEKGILNKDVDIEMIKEVFLIFSIVSTLGLLLVNMIITDIRNEKLESRQNDFTVYMKDVLTSKLCEIFNNRDLSFDVRIFVPHSFFVWKIFHFFYKKARLVFVCKNKKELAKEGIKDNLEFEVYPNIQGLVGLCYDTKQAQYDDELVETNSVLYNLNNSQIEKTRDLRFSLVYPIYDNEDKDNTVIAIVAIDSASQISIKDDQQQQLIALLSGFSQYLYKLVPEAFKGR